MVVPPAKPAAVPEKKSSDATVPMKGNSIWVWGSMPPGITSWPVASITSASAGAPETSPTALIRPSSHQTSPGKLRSAVTMVPFLMTSDMLILPRRD